MQATISVTLNGELRFIWNDDFAELLDHGVAAVSRASHVEPTNDGKWTADLGPVDGPMLGPFVKRQEALDAEVSWLQLNRGL